jgi:ketosteroid isomerase-like protein
MGADENVATMRRAYEAFNAGDMETLTELFDENCVWHTPGRSSLANDYEGRDATFGYFGRIGQETEGTLRANLEELTADDEGRVVGIQHSTADRNGKHLDVGNVIVFQLKDGRITDGRHHYAPLTAWVEYCS